MALRDIVTKDPGWKIFSVVLAVAIWLTVKAISTDTPVEHANPLEVWLPRVYTNVPVLIVSTAADMRECRITPDRVDVEVKVRPEVPGELLEKQIRVTVDLTDIESARGMRKRVDVSTPPGVSFVSVSPPDVEISIPPKRNNK